MRLHFAEILPPDIPRIALVDFYNTCVEESKRVLYAMFREYKRAFEQQDEEGMKRYTLFGVRADTAGELKDESLAHPPDSPDLYGVSPALIWALREGLDNAWREWELPPEWQERAATYCRNVRIVASGGFTAEKLERFRAEGVPVDFYGIGSYFFANCSRCGTTNDYTADVVRIKVHGEWIDLAKVGRRACDNPELLPVDY
ncbi:MAG: hypothetical protein ABIN58_04085 [candidate division WOR-3 bacterium]